MACIAGCASVGGGNATEMVSRPAPEFSLAANDGRKVSLSEFRGKVVVIDFWATWCPPCRESFPHLQAIAADAALVKSGVVVLAVNEREDWPAIRSFIRADHSSIYVLCDVDGSAARSYAVSTIPTTIIIGRDGIVRAVISDYTGENTAREIDAAIARAAQ